MTKKKAMSKCNRVEQLLKEQGKCRGEEGEGRKRLIYTVLFRRAAGHLGYAMESASWSPRRAHTDITYLLECDCLFSVECDCLCAVC